MYLCKIMCFFLQTCYSIGYREIQRSKCYAIASAVKIMKFTIQNKKKYIKNLPIRKRGHAYTRGKAKRFCII